MCVQIGPTCYPHKCKVNVTQPMVHSQWGLGANLAKRWQVATCGKYHPCLNLNSMKLSRVRLKEKQRKLQNPSKLQNSRPLSQGPSSLVPSCDGNPNWYKPLSFQATWAWPQSVSLLIIIWLKDCLGATGPRKHLPLGSDSSSCFNKKSTVQVWLLAPWLSS